MSAAVEACHQFIIKPLHSTSGTPGTRGFLRYRNTLRRHIPEPFLALLCFIWGVWIYDGWFGGKDINAPAEQQYAEANQRQTLVLHSLDRSLRLGDVLNNRQPWLGLLVGYSDRQGELHHAIEALASTDAESGGLNPRTTAVAALILHASGLPSKTNAVAGADAQPETSLLRCITATTPPAPADWEILTRLLGSPEARWWHLEVARQLANRPDAPATLAAGIRLEEAKNEKLLARATCARGGVGLLVLIGLAGVPAALRLLRSSVRPQIRRYPDRWPLGLTLAAFLVAELAGIGLTVAFGVLHAGEGELPFAALLPLDTVLRILPAAIAVAILFHRPRHALDRLGLRQPFPFLPLLGLFSLLLVLDEGLLIALDRWIPIDPTGGLDPAEAGLAGLVFLLVSACIVAPVAEETLYRGILFRGTISRLGPLAAAAASSLLFSLVHFYDVFGTASITLLGVTCALAYRATGSLLAAIAFHAVYNLSVTVPDWIINHSSL